MPLHRADAASLDDLWLRSDQQAAAALASGDAKTAASVARSPDWHGSASFRAGDYAAAADDYAKVQSADGAYNEGNALAKLGKYEDALASYDRALKLAPGMEDAKANKAAVEEWLKRQQQQKQQNQSSKNQQQKQKSGDKDHKNDQNDKSSRDQNQDQQQQSGEQKSDQDQKQQESDGKDQQNGDDEKEKQSDAQQQGGEQDQERQSSQGTEGSTSEAQSATDPSQGKPSGEQQKALTKEINQSLAQNAKPAKDGKPEAAVEEDDATQEKRQALEHLLQRVPDDPGGLLRRKFLLEHQRREQHGDDNG
jgi:Ca-activated chloride channel family protein